MTTNEPWKFELIGGECYTHVSKAILREEDWTQLDRERDAFMGPVWEARRKESERLSHEKYVQEANIKQHIEVIDGVEVWIGTQGPEDKINSAWIGHKDYKEARIRTSHKWSGSGALPFEVEYLVQLRPGAYNHYYNELRSIRGAALGFKTAQAAIRAAIRANKAGKLEGIL